jgi:hypothetical protein
MFQLLSYVLLAACTEEPKETTDPIEGPMRPYGSLQMNNIGSHSSVYVQNLDVRWLGE